MKMNKKELNIRRLELSKKILTMEWDKKRNQLNFALKNQLMNYKKELERIEIELDPGNTS